MLPRAGNNRCRYLLMLGQDFSLGREKFHLQPVLLALELSEKARNCFIEELSHFRSRTAVIIQKRDRAHS
jgi:hypothetical protein